LGKVGGGEIFKKEKTKTEKERGNIGEGYIPKRGGKNQLLILLGI